MSTFEVKAYDLVIEPAPGLDRLEMTRVGGYVALVPKGMYQTGDRALYIPEQALVPEEILVAIGVRKADADPIRENKAIGQGGNLVKAVKFKGVLSQGLIYQPWDIPVLHTDLEYAEDIGVKKYEPEIPAKLSGEVYGVAGITAYTGIEHIKKYPDILQMGETVIMSEKLHGSNAIVFWDGEAMHCSSRGNAKQHRALVDSRDEADRPTNLYWRGAYKEGLDTKLPLIAKDLGATHITLYGEVGPCQDLRYSFTKGQVFLQAFDLKTPQGYVDYDTFISLMEKYEISVAPILYRGPLSEKVLHEFTNGTTVFGDGVHTREGVVVKPVVERHDDTIGRVILKSIAEDYLLRKGGTEYQ